MLLGINNKSMQSLPLELQEHIHKLHLCQQKQEVCQQITARTEGEMCATPFSHQALDDELNQTFMIEYRAISWNILDYVSEEGRIRRLCGKEWGVSC